MRERLAGLLVPALLFFAIWAPRSIALDMHVTVDEPAWLHRSSNFTGAVVHRDWASTLRREHPGVTIMWMGLLGLLQVMPEFPEAYLADPVLYSQTSGSWPQADDWLDPLDLMVVSRRWIVLAVSLSLALAYFPLRRLLQPGPAAFAILFVAWAPMAMAFTRYLHPDSLLGIMSLVSFAFFLRWLYDDRRRIDLVISGVFMGLAWLTKTPAAVLALAGGVVAAIEIWQGRTGAENGSASSQRRSVLAGYLLWGIVAAAIYFLLWPAMWVAPYTTFQQIYETMVDYAGGHSNTNFFLGQIVDDPGWRFYPTAYLYRITPATLAGLLLAVVAFLLRLQPFDRALVRKTAMAMFILALAFTLLMSAIAKKFDRYILATFLSLDVVAALGWVALAQLAATTLQLRDTQKPSSAKDADGQRHSMRRSAPFWGMLLILLLAIGPYHARLTVEHYPHYITYYNPLTGGTKRAPEALFFGWGEGLEQVGAWLDQQPEATSLQAVSWYHGPLTFFFSGEARSFPNSSRLPWFEADYAVLYANQIQRKIPNERTVDYFLNRSPVYTATLQGMPMARVYDLNAITSRAQNDAVTPQAIPVRPQWAGPTLTGVESLNAAAVASILPVNLRWSDETGLPLRVLLRLTNENGKPISERYLPLLPEMQAALFIPPDAAPGTYALTIKLFDGQTDASVATVEGHKHALLADVVVTEPLVTTIIRWLPAVFAIEVALPEASIDRSEPLNVAVRWQRDPTGTFDRALKSRVGLYNEDGKRIAQADELLINEHGLMPGEWRDVERPLSTYRVSIDDEASAGVYQVRLLVYDAETLAPLGYVDEVGNPAGVEMVIGEVQID